MPSIALPRSSASLSSDDEVPRIFTRKSRLKPGKFLITSAKRLLQQNLPTPDSCTAAKSILTGAATTSTSHGCCCGGFERGQVIRTVAGSRREQFCSPQDFLVDPFLCAVTVVRSRSVKLIALTECCQKSGDVPKSPLQEKWQPDAVGGHKIAG